ncbi:HIT family protein [Sphingomonas sabuli]|uniref:HIT family protein n=1 Tax=Sphingomonas sabuli TaxID=2764186 RepID=A0A7G9L3R5_9SPHN|nr:HIT family protein [Sphingomonas sabuli]QNM83264.1 HIT family protein [Sphingomonas sabuli]
MANATMEKFGYPDTLIAELEHWAVLLRPAQVTLGSLILAAKSDVIAYGDLPAEAFAEQGEAVRRIEAALRSFCQYERINYLMLMMVDPNVHFHVIPRYEAARQWKTLTFADTGWPGPPSLKDAIALDGEQIAMLRDEIRNLYCGRA